MNIPSLSNLNPTAALAKVAVYILAVVLLVLLGVAIGWKLTTDHYKAQQAQVAIKDTKTAIKQGEVAVSVVTKYADAVKSNAVKSVQIEKEIHDEVPSDIILPARFRVLHDSAATSTLPSDTGLATAQPVTAQDLADTIADNYAACIDRGEQIKALQDFIVQERAVTLK